MEFIRNKYYRWYLAICVRGQERQKVPSYTEKHHIIPKSCGGSNKKENIANLTAREHFIAHMCLVKCTEGLHRKKMLSALLAFRRQNKTQHEEYQSLRFTSRHFAILRVEAARVHGERLKQNAEWKANVARAVRATNRRQEVQDKKRSANRESTSLLWMNPDYRARMITRMNETRSKPEYRQMMSDAVRRQSTNDRKKRSESAKKMWSDPVYRQRQIDAQRRSHPKAA